VTEYVDEAISGTTERRPALDILMSAVRARKVDVVVVAAFDRVGRSTRHLVETLDLFGHLGVEFISLREQIDTGSPLGQAIFTIIAAIAQLERNLLVERVRAGLRRARAQGKRIGRPPVRVDGGRLQQVLSRQLPSRAAALELGISASSYLRLLRMQLAPPSEVSTPCLRTPPDSSSSDSTIVAAPFVTVERVGDPEVALPEPHRPRVLSV
jgi:DNA invertase Pin-like site-specific DNA recombinase